MGTLSGETTLSVCSFGVDFERRNRVTKNRLPLRDTPYSNKLVNREPRIRFNHVNT